MSGEINGTDRIVQRYGADTDSYKEDMEGWDEVRTRLIRKGEQYELEEFESSEDLSIWLHDMYYDNNDNPTDEYINFDGIADQLFYAMDTDGDGKIDKDELKTVKKHSGNYKNDSDEFDGFMLANYFGKTTAIGAGIDKANSSAEAADTAETEETEEPDNTVGASPKSTQSSFEVNEEDLPAGYTIEDNKIMYGGVQIGEIKTKEIDTDGDGTEDLATIYYLYENKDNLPENCFKTESGEIYKFDTNGNKEKLLIKRDNKEEVQTLIKNEELTLDTSTGELKKGNVVVGYCKYDADNDSISDVYFNVDYYKHTFNNIPEEWNVDEKDGTIKDAAGNEVKAIKPTDFNEKFEDYTIKSGDTEVTNLEKNKTYDAYDGENLVGHIIVDAKGHKHFYEVVTDVPTVGAAEGAAADETEAAAADETEAAAADETEAAAADETEAATETKTEKIISDKAARMYAQELYNSMHGLGTDEKTFHDILDNDKLTPDDWVKIIQEFEKLDDGKANFISMIDGDFSGNELKQIQEKLAKILITAAENGNEDAIDLLCIEFQNGTSGMTCTADEFIAGIMDNVNDDILTKMLSRYEDVTGHDMYKDIKDDFSGNTETNYIQRLNQVLRNIED